MKSSFYLRAIQYAIMKRLNEKEEQVMQILWRLQRAFVKEILAELEDPRPPVTTVSSLVRKLESEGFVGHEAFGKTYRYYPVVKKEEYRRATFRDLVDNYFGGSPEQILSFFVQEEEVAPDELDELLEKIKKQHGEG